jgi:hypothetical protein
MRPRVKVACTAPPAAVFATGSRVPPTRDCAFAAEVDHLGCLTVCWETEL